MDKHFLISEVSSPADLENILFSYKPKRKDKFHYMILSLVGKGSAVCPFQFNDISKDELEDRVIFKAVELLNSSVEDIVADYQVFSEEDRSFSGIYICLLKSQIEEYLKIVDQAQISPLSLLPASLVTIDSLFQNIDQAKGRICILNFSKEQTVDLCMVLDRKCQLFREIPYYNHQDAARNIKQTIQSANAASKVKTIDQIYYYGESSNINEMIHELEQKLDMKFKVLVHKKETLPTLSKKSIFSLNLLKDYTLAMNKRRPIELVLTCILVWMIFVSIILTAEIIKKDTKIDNLKRLYKPAEYQQAKKLEQKLQEL